MNDIDITFRKIRELLEYCFVSVLTLRENQEFVINTIIESEKKEFDFADLTEEEIRETFNEEQRDFERQTREIIRNLNQISEVLAIPKFSEEPLSIKNIEHIENLLRLADTVATEVYASEIVTLEEMQEETNDVELKEQLAKAIICLEMLVERVLDFTAFCSEYLKIESNAIEDEKDKNL
ncbi:TPA: hypothetical protein ACLBZ1_005440 [Bacillus cereus]